MISIAKIRKRKIAYLAGKIAKKHTGGVYFYLISTQFTMPSIHSSRQLFSDFAGWLNLILSNALLRLQTCFDDKCPSTHATSKQHRLRFTFCCRFNVVIMSCAGWSTRYWNCTFCLQFHFDTRIIGLFLLLPSSHTTSEQRYYNVILTFKRRFNVHTTLF